MKNYPNFPKNYQLSLLTVLHFWREASKVWWSNSFSLRSVTGLATNLCLGWKWFSLVKSNRGFETLNWKKKKYINKYRYKNKMQKLIPTIISVYIECLNNMSANFKKWYSALQKRICVSETRVKKIQGKNHSIFPPSKL